MRVSVIRDSNQPANALQTDLPRTNVNKILAIALSGRIQLKKGIGPEYLLNKLKSRKDTHDHNTRRRNYFETTLAKKDFNKNKFFHKSFTDYNNILPLEPGRKQKNTGENGKLL